MSDTSVHDEVVKPKTTTSRQACEPDGRAAPEVILLGADLRAGNGVGDFARKVAEVWRNQGCHCALVDRRGGEGGEATAEAGVFLQFVPYAWNLRGLIWPRVRREIIARCRGRRVAVFMHELWIGESTHEPVLVRWFGRWQRHGVKCLLRDLHPVAILTSNTQYQSMLARERFAAEVWGLPGNLPVPNDSARATATVWWRERGLEDVEVAVVFGSIHPEWDGAAALKSWRAYLAKEGRAGVVLTLGRNGPEAGPVLERLAAAVPGLRVERGGPLPAGVLAGVLERASFGLSTSPWVLVGKSGTVATFRELGVPVLVTRDDWRWRRGDTLLPREAEGLRRWQKDMDWSVFLAERTIVRSNMTRHCRDLLPLLQGRSAA